ncbi:MAG: hypothetical protein M3349_01275 [Actinomycetota bacterium]|nr:hypothetical protein [Actinomycetota bacterium]
MLALVPVMGGVALLIAYALAIASGSEHVSAFGVVVVASILVAMVAMSVTSKEDKKWLPTMIMAGFTAKIVASTVRWWVLVDLYDGSGDAPGYHKLGTEYVHLWRSFELPPMELGTEAMEGLVGLVYVPYVPNFLGGFYMFATLAFIGQIFCYMAFRNSTVPRRLKLYAAAVFFVPTVVYWPSSIGKESVVMFGLGFAAYGISKVLKSGAMGSLFTAGFGLVIIGLIRPHMAAMVAAAAVFALAFCKGTGIALMRSQRATLLVVSVIGLAGVTVVAAANLNLSLDSDLEGQISTLVESVEGQTDTGGSSVEGAFISSPLELPEVTLRVLFRPLPYEADNIAMLASSVEGTLMLALVLWRLIPMVKRGFRARPDPYMLFCMMYTFLFIIAFSSFLNLGLMARERSQVMPFFLAMIVALGFRTPDEPEEEVADQGTDMDMDTGELLPYPSAPVLAGRGSSPGR